MGGPIGRRSGTLRGFAAGLISILSSDYADRIGHSADGRDLKHEVTEISRELNNIQFSELSVSSEVKLPENNLEELKNASSMDERQKTSEVGDAAYEKLRTLEGRLQSLCAELGITLRL